MPVESYMLNKDAQKRLAKADPYIKYMREIGKEPSSLGFFPADYTVIVKAIESCAKREKIKDFPVSDFRYRGFPICRQG